MQCLVVYDIVDDAKRLKVAEACLDYGLDRIQYSAFLGDLRVTHQEELMMKITRLLGKHAGNVQLFPICEKDWVARRCVVIEGVVASHHPPDSLHVEGEAFEYERNLREEEKEDA